MTRKRSRVFGLLLSAALLLAAAHRVDATAIANSEINLFNLEIIPSAGTIQFLDLWTAEVFALARNSLGELDAESNSAVGGTVSADAVVTFAEGHSSASAPSLTANASSSVNIPGGTVAASSVGLGTLVNSFLIIGVTGLVDVAFSVDISVSLAVLTDAFGLLAETETIFSLEVDGNPTLFRHDLLSVGPNSASTLAFSENLFGILSLPSNTEISIVVPLDSESVGINVVPEPSTLALLVSGLTVLGGFARTRAQRRKRATPPDGIMNPGACPGIRIGAQNE